MSWQITTLIFILTTSARAIQIRRIGLFKKDVSVYLLVASFTCILFVGLVTSLLNWNNVDHLAAFKAWPFILVGGLMFASVNIVVYKLYRYIPASIMAFTTLLNTLSVVLFATLAGGESLSSRQLYGAFLLFISVITGGLLTNKSKKSNNNIGLAIGIIVIVALLFGPAIMNEKYLISRIGFNTYLFYGWGLQALSAFLLAIIFKNRSVNKQKLSKHIHFNVWISGALLGLGGLAFVTSLSHSGSASTLVLSSTATIGLTVFIAYFVLKEKDHLLAKIFGLILSVFGLLLLLS